MKKVLTISFCLLGLLITSSVSAQATATANASATIVTPISIAKTADMNFGNIATDGNVGTVVLTPGSARTFTGGVTLPAATGTVTAASFTVTGSGAYTYAITLPASVTITSGSDSMIVDNFTSTPSGTGTLSSGTQTINVGATLNLVASQAEGTYTSATAFPVTVNYN
ncbi:DUF4402 domain-containing protein [Flavobacterium sp. DG1-102-2]|uniref:DUF4402 domain-containing protein n=1 Tax=Flavobacterium sp. DG1-102-2 TaxID=3081663 RepID=UPI002949813E|nr:DUF4402 domain-containing protein [Flavobacterium sp. DG1-102-2]MDV6166923.1 DUF4402 domain-containing protein [Flavobacterium sp. DG1-102-2]